MHLQIYLYHNIFLSTFIFKKIIAFITIDFFKISAYYTAKLRGKMSASIGVIFSADRKKVLVLQRRDVPMWVLPGGGIDAGETAESAVIREVLEETGLNVEITRKVAEYTPLNKMSKLTFLFECRVISGTLSTGDETRNIGFYDINALPEPFFPVHQDWLDDTLENSKDVIYKPVWRVTYWNIFKYFCRHPMWVIKFALTRMGFSMNSNDGK